MAALNFPDSPNVNDVFTVGSREWIWDGSAWVSNSGREYTRLISDTAPSSPIEGDEWFNSSTGKLYIYYDSYWLEVGASVSGVDGTDGVDATLTRTIRSESADTSLVSGDANQVIRFTGTSAQVLTVDDVLSVGDRVEVIQDNSGSVEFSSGSGVTLLSTTGGFFTSGQNAKIEVMCVAAGEYRLFGDLFIEPTFILDYVIIAGGGSGGGEDFSIYGQGGGGAGGYRSSVIGESSGGGASAEQTLSIETRTEYTVTVGAGGAANVSSTANGSNSVFSTITSLGGGGGAGESSGGNDGGSGGGGRYQNIVGGSGTAGQGFDGADHTDGSGYGVGGGGAGQAGQMYDSNRAGDGGDGVASSITGSAVTRAGGGGGGDKATAGGGGLGGSGGGGKGADDLAGTAGENGVANTGGGGGGASADDRNSGSGGSGVVILRYPAIRTITIGSGLTGTTSTVGANKVTEITAGTGNVSWS